MIANQLIIIASQDYADMSFTLDALWAWLRQPALLPGLFPPSNGQIADNIREYAQEVQAVYRPQCIHVLNASRRRQLPGHGLCGSQPRRAVQRRRARVLVTQFTPVDDAMQRAVCRVLAGHGCGPRLSSPRPPGQDSRHQLVCFLAFPWASLPNHGLPSLVSTTHAACAFRASALHAFIDMPPHARV